MCGISGMVAYGVRDHLEQDITRMNSSLSHRGPDGTGFFQFENAVIGHTRLAIIDLSDTANQPLFNEDKSVAVVFNGEIYNFHHLRHSLEKSGHRFISHTDSEVIVHAWEEFGPDCVQHFRGMFSFCILDTRTKELFVARDRLGKKPLYFSLTGNHFAFASEMKALLSLPGTSAEIDPISLGEFATYGYYTGTRSIYQQINKLPPGSALRISCLKRPDSICPQRYWKISINPNPELTECEWLDRLDATLSEAVQLRMVSDVPLGAFLSGGVDSSLVTAYMARISSAKIKTFTIGFTEASHDESRHARMVADYLGTEHTMEIVSPDTLALLPEIIAAYDEPFGDFSAIPTFYLCRMAKNAVTVALSGDGGDELFLGYERYVLGPKLNFLASLIGRPGREAAKNIARHLPYGSTPRRVLDSLSLTGVDLYNYFIGFRQERLSLLHQDIVAQVPEHGSGIIRSDYEECGGASVPVPYQYCDVNNYLPEDILLKVDRASMHHALEVRCPLLDNEFVELAATIPASFNLGARGGKKMLKSLAARVLPQAILDRPKQGFGMPLRQWFKADLQTMLQEMTGNTSSRMWNYFDRREVTRRIQHHQQSNAIDSSAVIWRLLFFYYWCEVKR